MMPALLSSLAIPIARRWVAREEARVLARGVSLTESQISDARRAGVRQPREVRVLRVAAIPMPGGAILGRANRLLRVVSPATVGITFGYGICIRTDFWDDRALLVHELVHVAQYERYASRGGFLRDYLRECLADGYPHGRLEREAIAIAADICR